MPHNKKLLRVGFDEVEWYTEINGRDKDLSLFPPDEKY